MTARTTWEGTLPSVPHRPPPGSPVPSLRKGRRDQTSTGQGSGSQGTVMSVTRPLADCPILCCCLPLDTRDLPLPGCTHDPGQGCSLTQSSMCLVISGTSTESFSAVTMRAGIRIWWGTGHRSSGTPCQCPLPHPNMSTPCVCGCVRVCMCVLA